MYLADTRDLFDVPADAVARGVAAPLVPIPTGAYAEMVTDVEHLGERAFCFRLTRTARFRFRSGEFVMLGLPNAERPLFRAFSIASPAWDDELAFYAIKAPEGPLTRHLQHIRPLDTVLVREQATGGLVLDAMRPGRRLYLFATGAGIAPFASLVRDPETYERFDEVILTNTCRESADLAFGDRLANEVELDPMIAAFARGRFRYYPSVTGELFPRIGRVTTLVATGSLFRDLGLPPMDPAEDRAMICGGPAMIAEMRGLLEAFGLREGSEMEPGDFVAEPALAA